jgi:hypothetical protein
MWRIALIAALALTSAFDAGKTTGTIRSFQGTNAGPLPRAVELRSSRSWFAAAVRLAMDDRGHAYSSRATGLVIKPASSCE